MTYLAPRQGLFAIIVCASFTLHTVMLMVSTENQISKNRIKKGERLVAELIDEAAVALSYEDRVSLGNITERYTKEYDINGIVVLDTSHDSLITTGDARLQTAGAVIEEIATRNDAVIGTVQMTMRPTTTGEIIKMMWLFILSSMVLHFFIWLIYGYIARPTKEQLRSLSREIKEYHFPDYVLVDPKQLKNFKLHRISDGANFDINRDVKIQSQSQTKAPEYLKDEDKISLKEEISGKIKESNPSTSTQARTVKAKSPKSNFVDKFSQLFQSEKTEHSQRYPQLQQTKKLPKNDNNDAPIVDNESRNNNQKKLSKAQQLKNKFLSHQETTEHSEDELESSKISSKHKTSKLTNFAQMSDHNESQGQHPSMPLTIQSEDHNTSTHKYGMTEASVQEADSPVQKLTNSDELVKELNDSSEATVDDHETNLTRRLRSRATKSKLTANVDSDSQSEQKHSLSKELSNFISVQQHNQASNPFHITVSDDEPDLNDADLMNVAPSTAPSRSDIPDVLVDSDNMSSETLSTQPPKQQALIPETLQVQINFLDKYDLFSKLSADHAKPYLALCSELLYQATIELLKQPQLQGVGLSKRPSFNTQGAVVDLQSKGNSQKLAMAGMMLSVLYRMLNEIIYDKHRELNKFALTVAIGVSQEGRENAMMKLLNSRATDHDVIMLLAKNELEFVESRMKVKRIPSPNNVSERECVYVETLDDELLQSLTKVCNAVLKVD